MKIKRLLLVVFVICFSVSATGCGEALYTMTDEEETVVSLYAAKMVSKFNKNQTNGICNARIKEGELGSSNVESPENEDFEEEQVDEVDDGLYFDSDTGELIDRQDENTEIESGYSFTDAIGIENVEFSCSSFEVSKEYKANSSFILTSVKGKSYVVLKIKGSNLSDEDVSFDGNVSYKLSVNGSEYSSTQETFLNNDLSSYKKTLKSGESKDFVLVFLFSDSAIDNITSLSLQVTNNGTTREANI